MTKDTKIREAQNRIIEVYTKRPKAALSTVQASARIEDGIACVFTQGEQRLVMDLPEIMGGDATGPTPGLYARASISGCVAMAIKQLAARKGLVFQSINVDIEMDLDDRALFGLGNASAAPLETRLFIQIETNIAEAEVATIVDEAMEMDTYFLALRDAQQVKLSVEVQAE